VPGLHPHIDPDGLLEYSVVFTDRSLNHMSARFREVMRTISSTLKNTYAADSVAVVPGGGTYAMEAVARQFATGKRCLVLRNGWFSYRWTQIFDVGSIPAKSVVLKARPVDHGPTPAFAPAPIDEVIATIAVQRPEVVFAAHVETSAGIVLPDDYLSAVADATQAVGGIFVLDAIASGALWVDMERTGVDVLISAPQKGWSGSPCAGLVMFGPEGRARLGASRSTSFATDLHAWTRGMDAYVDGGQVYHATMPTDSLRFFSEVMLETHDFGLDKARARQWELGNRVRALLAQNGFKSVAAQGFEAPGVVVSYTDDPAIQNGARFAAAGLQIAAGVPLRCNEPDGFRTFRLGLFGLDKLANVDRTVGTFASALEQIHAMGGNPLSGVSRPPPRPSRAVESSRPRGR